MSISLRVVGVFYNRPNFFDFTEGMTVKDLLDAAVAKENNSNAVEEFQYYTNQACDSKTLSLSAFKVKYKQGAPVSPTSGIHYPPGEYYLAEQLGNKPAYSVWQYYIFKGNLDSGNAIYVPRPAPPKRLQSFKDAVIPEDNCSVVWRLVTILADNNTMGPRYSKK